MSGRASLGSGRSVHKVNSKVRVGLILNIGTGWLGGVNYARNLLTALHRLPSVAIAPVIFTGSSDRSLFSDFPPFEIVQSELVNPGKFPWFMRKGIATISSRDRLFERLLQRHGVSVLSHSDYLGTGSPIASIGWIPDFQFLHLPELYSTEEVRKRSRVSMKLCKYCDKVIVSSECAKADLQSFAPQYAHKARVLQFVATPQMASDLPQLPKLQQKYAFDEPYFLLPNQFWAHKNHRVVIGALRVAKEQGRRVQVLATGSTVDHRNPGYFDSLMEYARECDVLDLFRVLGVIPFEDLSGLMRSAIAFINPSRFEGWSTTVEEAKSMGKRILLSDIPVHREQSPELGSYFHPEDPEGLAELLWAAHKSYDPGADVRMQEFARERFPHRQKLFAETYQSIVLSVAR